MLNFTAFAKGGRQWRRRRKSDYNKSAKRRPSTKVEISIIIFWTNKDWMKRSQQKLEKYTDLFGCVDIVSNNYYNHKEQIRVDCI